MPDELLLDYDPTSGLKEWISTDEETGISHIRYEQDVQPILDYNKEMQANNDLNKRDDMWHAAKIPAVIIYEWMTKFGVNAFDQNHKEGVKRLLNSNEYRYLRVNHFIM